MTHECFSENYLLIPRLPQQLAASEHPKSVQNSRHIGRDAHDSNKIARNSLDTGQIKPNGEGHAIFARASMCFHFAQMFQHKSISINKVYDGELAFLLQTCLCVYNAESYKQTLV